MNELKFFTIFMIGTMIVYTIIQMTKRSINCSMISNYSKPTLSSIGIKDPRFNLKLYDYYIKSSYNSCATGNFVNDWVDMCSLKNVIKQGYRLLDFEIYDLNNTAIVSTSDSTKYTIKGTYNYLKLDDVIQHIANNAISMSMSTDECPNASDPLFLHFRIKSNHLDIYNSVANSINVHLSKYLLSSEYSYENHGHNLGNVSLKSLLNKIIIIVDKQNDKLLLSSKLKEYVNIAGNSVFMRVLSYKDVVHTPDMDELIDYNRTKMTICTPDDANNYNSSISMQYGVQFSCLNAQMNDSLLEANSEIFNEFAFSLKPEKLRKINVTVETVPDPDMNQSYGYKTHKTDYYEFNL
jgi:hypothetical protein